MIIKVSNWTTDGKKKRPTGNELLSRYLRESECNVSFFPGEGMPESVHIEFHGELARIPSLKNSKIPDYSGFAVDRNSYCILMGLDLYNELKEYVKK